MKNLLMEYFENSSNVVKSVSENVDVIIELDPESNI